MWCKNLDWINLACSGVQWLAVIMKRLFPVKVWNYLNSD